MSVQPVKAAFTAKVYNSGFPQAALTYNALSSASDGKIYYALTSEVSNIGAQMFRCDPATGAIQHLGDLTAACGEANLNAVVQGKCHVNFLEMGGLLYFATHLGYYKTVNGRELQGDPPPGVKPYPGGHFLTYNLKSGEFRKLGAAPAGEGIIATALDQQRDLMYGLTWPSGDLLRLDLENGRVVNLGPTSAGGEKADPPDYRVLCRALVLDPVTGHVFLSTADGLIMRAEGDTLAPVTGISLKRAVLGQYNVSSFGELAWNWRQTVYHAAERTVYGVHGRTGQLFSFHTGELELRFIRRITSEPTTASGEFDLEHHGFLSFKLAPGGAAIFYLTGAHIDDQASAAGKENIHLVTYEIATGEYRDHGPILLETGGAPTGVNSIAIAGGKVFAFSKIAENGHTRYDLIGFPFAGAY